MIAAKQMDIIIGVDIHMIQPPGPVPPVPIPHPFIGMVLDPMDCLPFIGAKVMVNGMPRATAGTGGKATSPHVPIGGTFVPPLPSNEGEIFMGSSTVLADGAPFTYLGLMTLTCQSIGMLPPPRPKKKKKVSRSMVLPTSVVIAIPMGFPVIVGGTPTIDLMAMAMRFGLAGLGKLRRSRFMRRLGARMRAAANRARSRLRSLSQRFRNALARVRCFITGHPVDVATGMVFTEIIDFEIPGVIPLKWERVWYSTSDYNGPMGYGWHHTYDMAMAFDEENIAIAIRIADGRIIEAPSLEVGEKIYNRSEKLLIFRDEEGYGIRDKNYLFYRFNSSPIGKDAIYPLVRIENTSKVTILFDYDDMGYLKQIKDSSGRVFSIKTDYQGRIKQIDAPHPDIPNSTFAIIACQYDNTGNLIEVKDALQQPFTYRYRGHLLLQETNRNNLSFYFAYDGDDTNARCIRTWGDGGIYDHKLTYNLVEKWTIVENSLGVIHKHYWTDQGLVYKTIDPSDNEKFARYDEDSQIIAEINELGHQTYYEYDEWGNQVEIRYPDGTKIQMNYNEESLLSIVDKNGGHWKWLYNEKKQLIKKVDSLGNTYCYFYNDQGRVQNIIDPAGGYTQIQYNERADPIEIINPNGAVFSRKYDLLGRCTAIIDCKQNVQLREFNLLGWICQINEPDSDLRQIDYDGECNIIRVKNSQSEVRFEYSGMNRIKAYTEAGTRVEFKYDTEENLIGIINEHGYAYRFELDFNGQVVVESGFDGVTRRYKRDAAGRVIEVARPGGLKTQYTYDALDRVLEVKHSDGSKEQFSYRLDGELLEANNDHIKVRFERDKLGRVIKETQGGFVIESKYNKLGWRTELTSSLGAHLQFKRNEMGDVENIHSLGTNQSWSADFKRDILGMEEERHLPGGVQSTWKRDQLGRPLEQRTVTGGGRLMRIRKYTWEVNDRLRQLSDPQQGTWRFEHDVFGNLTAAQYPDGTQEYRMPDAVGNLFRSPDRKDRKYGPAGQLLEANGTRYEYDAEGNLIKKIERSGAIWKYEWNAAGMLRKVIRPDGEAVTFTYDALGRRIAKRFRQHTTCWVWDGNVMLHEWVEQSPENKQAGIQILPKGDSSIKIRKKEDLITTEPSHGPPLTANALTEFSFQAPTELITWVFEAESFAPLAKFKGTEQYSIISDYLGTPVEMYDNSGAKVWDMNLSIYGEVQQVEGWRDACPFRYPGQYEDEETGLHYNRWRYYNKSDGVYLSKDPIRLWGGMNFYAYVSNPNVVSDPLGLMDIFRSMTPASDGQPTVGESARTLGARPIQDIPVDSNGMVHPNSGGISVAPSPEQLPAHRRPPEFGGTGRDPVWRINTDNLGDDLVYVPDGPNHGTIQPRRTMTLQQYQDALARTRGRWVRVCHA